MQNAPKDVVLYILSFLDIFEKGRFALTCKVYYKLLRKDMKKFPKLLYRFFRKNLFFEKAAFRDKKTFFDIDKKYITIRYAHYTYDVFNELECYFSENNVSILRDPMLNGIGPIISYIIRNSGQERNFIKAYVGDSRNEKCKKNARRSIKKIKSKNPFFKN